MSQVEKMVVIAQKPGEFDRGSYAVVALVESDKFDAPEINDYIATRFNIEVNDRVFAVTTDEARSIQEDSIRSFGNVFDYSSEILDDSDMAFVSVDTVEEVFPSSVLDEISLTVDFPVEDLLGESDFSTGVDSYDEDDVNSEMKVFSGTEAYWALPDGDLSHRDVHRSFTVNNNVPMGYDNPGLWVPVDEVEKVSVKDVRKMITFHPLPKVMHDNNGKFWGVISDVNAPANIRGMEAFGKTQKDIVFHFTKLIARENFWNNN